MVNTRELVWRVTSSLDFLADYFGINSLFYKKEPKNIEEKKLHELAKQYYHLSSLDSLYFSKGVLGETDLKKGTKNFVIYINREHPLFKETLIHELLHVLGTEKEKYNIFADDNPFIREFYTKLYSIVLSEIDRNVTKKYCDERDIVAVAYCLYFKYGREITKMIPITRNFKQLRMLINRLL